MRCIVTSNAQSAFGRHGEPCRRAGRHPQGRSAVLRVSAAHQPHGRLTCQRFSWRPPQPGLRHIRALPCCSAQRVRHIVVG
jgi:hypothetical protein